MGIGGKLLRSITEEFQCIGKGSSEDSFLGLILQQLCVWKMGIGSNLKD